MLRQQVVWERILCDEHKPLVRLYSASLMYRSNKLLFTRFGRHPAFTSLAVCLWYWTTFPLFHQFLMSPSRCYSFFTSFALKVWQCTSSNAILAVLLAFINLRQRAVSLASQLPTMLIVHVSSTCDVCYDPLSSSNECAKAPYSIPCGHVFCRA